MPLFIPIIRVVTTTQNALIYTNNSNEYFMLTSLRTIISYIFSVKLDFLLYILTLRMIKSPFYSVLDLFIVNPILKYFIFLLVGF